jgi:hypothetical protein
MLTPRLLELSFDVSADPFALYAAAAAELGRKTTTLLLETKDAELDARRTVRAAPSSMRHVMLLRTSVVFEARGARVSMRATTPDGQRLLATLADDESVIERHPERLVMRFAPRRGRRL